MSRESETRAVVQKIRTFVSEWYDHADKLYVTSDYRAVESDGGTWSHHNGQIYDGSRTAAVDFAAPMTDTGRREMQRFARWMYDNFGDLTVEMLHSTPFPDDNGFLVRNQQRYPLGYPEHNDHVHYATSDALIDAMQKRAVKQWGSTTPGPIPTTGEVFGWDASNHDWGRGSMDIRAAVQDGISFFTHKASEGINGWYIDPYYQRALTRAREANVPVLGAYFVLHPGDAFAQADQFFHKVNAETPWWKTVPWIWQLDAEKFDYMDRAPNLQECQLFMRRIKELSAGHGWVVAYAPKWLYGDSLQGLEFDLWASNYDFSGAARPYREQWNDVNGRTSGFNAYSGQTPKILQYSSDATIGTQPICDANKFNGTLSDLLALTGGTVTQPTGEPTWLYESHPKPDKLEGRSLGVLVADLWGQEMFETSPYQDGAPSLRTAQLGRIESKLDELLSRLNGVPGDVSEAVIVEAVKRALREGVVE